MPETGETRIFIFAEVGFDFLALGRGFDNDQGFAFGGGGGSIVIVFIRRSKGTTASTTASTSATAFQVLNLFAYTGGSSLACARGGAHVVHVDSSKTSVAWARENAEISQLAAKPIRWIVEDVRKFVQREVRRGSKYHGIILDPPTYGRGGNAEIWQIEDHLPPLLDDLEKILADDFSFVMLCAHSNGYTPLALKNLVHDMLRPRAKLKILEKGDGTAPGNRPGDSANQRLLPSGAMCLTVRKYLPARKMPNERH